MRKLFTIGMFLMFFSGVYSQSFNIDGIEYVIISKTQTAEVSYGGDYRGDMVIPSVVSNLGVTYAVTSIGLGAFSSSWQLTSIAIPGSVKVIHTKAFYKCIGLKQIFITEAIDSIGNSAFENCTSLTSFALPFAGDGTIIGDAAFYNCNKMTAASLPNSVQSIGYGAFGYCSSLQSFDIPNGFTSIKANTFIWCSSLISITIPGNITTIESNAFSGCTGLKSVSIPNSVKTIEWNAFYKCSSLPSITIPPSVTTIGTEAFAFCSNLNSVHVESVNPILITSDCFQAVPYSSILYVPDNAEIDYKHAAGWKDFFTIKGTTTIFNFEGINYRTISSNEVEAFSWNNLYYIAGTQIDIPPVVSYDSQIYKVVSIRNMAFFNWTQPTKMVLPGGVNSIGENAFASCINLKEINTPSVTTTIGNFAFSNCGQLHQFRFPASITSIGDMAFNNCPGFSDGNIWIEVDNPAKITLGMDVFKGLPYANCVLYVPKGTYDLYSKAPQWGAFDNIKYPISPKMGVNTAKADILHNIREFDYDAYYKSYSEFDFASAFSFYLTATSSNLATGKIRIYPTVVNESINITGLDEKSTIKIFDIKGSVVLSQIVDNNSQISISTLPKSVYLVKITGDKNTFTQRIIKE